MSGIMLNVLDGKRSIHARVHVSDGARTVAALAADPETIEELDVALDRFLCREPDVSHFDAWGDGVCWELFDDGIIAVDLAGRLVSCESSCGRFSQRGSVERDEAREGDHALPYHLADDWALMDDISVFEPLSAERRARRSHEPQQDDRAVIYDRLPEFVVGQLRCRAADLPEMDVHGRYALAREIHALWLLTPRDDLDGRCPRAVLLDPRHDHIVWDLQNQCQFWSTIGHSPPAIPRESAAYRFAGFGTHEIVLYYDLVRHLLHQCIEATFPEESAPSEVAQQVQSLRHGMQEWLHAANQSDLRGQSPAAVIDRERRRLPEVVSGEDAMIDHDCPLCQMMADEHMGPTFWHLDGCNMDDDFAFSLHRTRQSWEEEQREYEQWSRKFEDQWRRDQAFIEGRSGARELLGFDSTSPVWQSSHYSSQLIDDLPPEKAMTVILFAVGSHLCELGEDLTGSDTQEQLARSLRSYFTELRRAIADQNSWMVQSSIAEFQSELSEVKTVRADLRPKCVSLEEELDRLLECCCDDPRFDDTA